MEIVLILSIIGIVVIWKLRFKSNLKYINEYMRLHSRIQLKKVNEKDKDLVGLYKYKVKLDDDNYRMESKDLYESLEIGNEYYFIIYKDLIIGVEEED